jgi:hypothetical protein
MGKPRLEQLALFLLLPGSLFFGLGWLLGIVLVWCSRRWDVRDKVIATLCPPGGFFLALYLLLAPGPSETCTGGMTADGRTWEQCTGGASTLVHVLAIAALIVLAIMPFVTAVYLNRRLDPPRPTTRLSPV